MFILLLSLFSGLAIGWLFRHHTMPRLDRFTTILVWLLLFLLGLEAGRNDYLMQRLPTLGLEALILTVGGVIGSALLAKWLAAWAGKKGEQQ